MPESVRDRIADLRTRRLLIVLALALGAALRLAYLYDGENLAPLKSEMQRVTATFASSGEFANPYGGPTGPTAHVSPFGVLIGTAAYRLFGVESAAAEFVLACYSIAVTLLSFFLLYRVFRQLRTDAATALAALGFLSLVVIHQKLEVVAFRILEGSVAVALIAWFLTRLQPIDRGGDIRTIDLLGIALVLGVLMLVSPSAAMGGYIAAAYTLVRRLRAPRLLGAGLILATGFALCVGPWAYRNQAVFGHPILTRSNFGLELAISYNDAAVSGEDRRQTYLEALETFHPLNSDQARATVQKIGEIDYMNSLGERAKAWISEHPGEALSILFRHVITFVWPSGWMSNQYAEPTLFNRIQAFVLGVLGLLALIQVGRILFGRRWEYLPLLITFGIAVAPYVIVQPMIRYRYLIYGLSVFLAFSLVSELTRRAWGRFSPPAPRAHREADAELA